MAHGAAARRPEGGAILRDLGAGAGIVATTTVAAVLYGIAHDQVTVRICLEYFSVFHPPVVPVADPTTLALVWGVLATWWGGVLVGIPLAVAARAGRGPKRGAGDLLRPLGLLLLAMAAAAVLAGAVGRLLALQGWVRVHPDGAGRIPREEHVDFLTALWIHNGSYLAGFVGGAILVVRTWRSRKGRRGGLPSESLSASPPPGGA